MQVTATPKRVRKNVDAGDAAPVPKMPMLAPKAPESGSSCIPSSAVRPAVAVRPANSRANSARSAVQETPSRGPAKFVSFAGEPVCGLKLPVPAVPGPAVEEVCPAAVQCTPSKSRAVDAMLFATPTKAGAARLGHEKREVEVERKSGGEISIYDALGWEDDVDDLG